MVGLLVLIMINEYMNTEDFVTYEQALALKKLGFKEECLFFYNVHGEFNPNSVYDGYSDVNDASRSLNFQGRSKLAGDAPTLAQAQKWLREKKDIIVLSTCNLDYENGHSWYWFVDKIFAVEDLEHSYKTYEEALSAGITECIKLLEK